MFCRIYVFINNQEVEFLMNSMAVLIDAKITDSEYINKIGLSAEIRRNKNYNTQKAREFPDGFLYFPFCIEIEINELLISHSIMISDIDKILKNLWDNGKAAVVSCSFEHFLTKAGGYKNREIPWIP